MHPKLLVIDDDRIQCVVISHAAVKAGFDVIVADSVAKATEVLERERFACITLDLSLNEHHGVELLLHIARVDPAARVVIISGLAEDVIDMATGVAESLRLKTEGPLTKPIKIGNLLRLLEAVARDLEVTPADP